VFSLHIDTARNWRGGQSHVLTLVQGLRGIGQRAVLVAHPDGELMRRMREGHDLVPIGARGEIDLSAAWRLSRVIKRLAPEVIHAHDPHAVAMAATALSIVTPIPKPPLVASRRIVAPMASNSFSRWKYSQVDCFIVTSQAMHDRLAADGVPRQKLTVVHEGVDVERIVQMPAANVHAEFYLPTHAPVIGTVGALVPHKGHHHLIDAAALVLREVPDARFVIVGDGELREGLERHVRDKHLERHIFLAGFRPDALALTKGFDLFAVSSITEGMCAALIDAMAAAKAAVATTAGAIPEVVVDRETGYLVPPRDHGAMADRLVALLKDAGLRTWMGKAGLARVRARFTVERMVGEIAAVYARLAGTGRAADTANLSARG
jgi:glycosyltransferase involved in cell wall biosynthesis